MRRRSVLLGAAALAGCAQTPLPQIALPSLGQRRPIVIAHRGASGERPEHTIAAYRLAIAQGADVIEPDLVLSKDGVFVCRHENEISGTTDVAARAEFADRRTVKRIDGVEVSGWFTEDFTLAELKTLRCKERLPDLRPGSAYFDGQETIPTFDEVLRLALEGGVGVCPELKHPRHFQSVGLDMSVEFMDRVGAWRRERAGPRIFAQCFEIAPLRRLAELGSFANVESVQLIAAGGGPADEPARRYADMVANDGLRAIAQYADAIGVEKSLIIPRDAQGRSLPTTNLVGRAHFVDLKVYVWTFRAENYFLPLERRRGDPEAPDYLRTRGDLEGEIAQFADLGVDGVFTDHTAPAIAALR
ncbi:MAG: glycerophosphodiester phosphodiesterase family protein [Hyphomonadaceae bacterium]|nr:glycerophosphodiester phosphodiesterase family protein [Hyphomonadaceae bacterium]